MGRDRTVGRTDLRRVPTHESRPVPTNSAGGATDGLPSPGRASPARWVGALTLSAALMALAWLAASMWSGWADVADAVRGIGAAALAALLLLSLVNYALRLARWHRYLGPSAGSVPLFEHGLIYLAGFALTTTPGKAGETLRTAYLFRYGIGAARSVGAFVAERLSDVLLMLLFGG